MAIREELRFITDDGTEHKTMAEAQAHDEATIYDHLVKTLGGGDMFENPMSSTAQALERIGLEIRNARLRAGGSKRPRKAVDPVKTEELRAELQAACAGAPEPAPVYEMPF